MMTRTILAASLAGLALGGCAVGAATVATVQDKSVGTAVDDSHIASTIKRKMLFARGYRGVDVEVSDGLVLLTGRVKTVEKRVQAEQFAWSSRNTKDVANEIRIGDRDTVRDNAGDAFISSRVRSRFLASSNVRSVNYNIETYDNVVYLMGVARTQEELRKAAELASQVPNVREVISYVEVREDRSPSYQAQQDNAYRGADGPDAELVGGSY